MADDGEWVECVQPTSQFTLPQDMSTLVALSGGMGVPVTLSVADRLTAIMEHKGNHKGSSINKVLRMWPFHYQQFGSFVTKMSDTDRDALQIVDPKIVQAKIDSHPREKVLQAPAEEKVSYGQLGIRQGSILEANSKAIDLPTFKVNENISAALSLVEEAKVAVDKLELGQAAKMLLRHLRRVTRSLKSACTHTQLASFVNAGVRYASMATVDVGAR